MSGYPISEVEAQTLRSAPYIEQMRQQAQTVERSLDLPGQPETLWSVFSATDFLNQQVGMQATDIFFLEQDSGAPWMHAQTKNAGLTVAYEELPYEWQAPFRYHVERLHSKGPLKYMRFGVELSALDASTTRVTCRIGFVSHLPNAVARVLIQKEIGKFMKLFQRLATQQQGQTLLKAFYAPEGAHAQQIQALCARWEPFEPDASVRWALADYILRAPERLAYRIRPRELAAAYALDPLDLTKACLRLTRHQQLHLIWDCRCPGCKGPKESFQHLAELKAVAYCESCAVQYGVAFDQNLELSFQPARDIRPVRELFFCAGSPANTPHISWQVNLLPGQRQRAVLALAPGYYVLRSLLCPNEITVLIDPAGADSLELSVSATLDIPAESAEISLRPGALLQLHNQRGVICTLMLENITWQSQTLSAADVQSVQSFHDLFPDEVLAPGESLPLQSQVFLLAYSPPASTAAAEIQALCHALIQQHQGAAVVLAPDRTLGIFASAYEALAAAWEMRQELSGLNLMYEQPESLVVALSQGPCEVYSDGQRLNYRGPALDTLELIREQGHDAVVACESFFQHPSLAVFFDQPESEWLRLPQPEGEDWLQMREQAVESLW
ncbi:MAG: DUF5939 domain-containing protein [Candidatus Sericytochromatia bacterium]